MAIPTVLWVATGGLRHPRPGLKRSELGLLYGAGHQWGGGQNRGSYMPPLPAGLLIRRWHRGRCLPRLRIPRIGVDAAPRRRVRRARLGSSCLSRAALAGAWLVGLQLRLLAA